MSDQKTILDELAEKACCTRSARTVTIDKAHLLALFNVVLTARMVDREMRIRPLSPHSKPFDLLSRCLEFIDKPI